MTGPGQPRRATTALRNLLEQFHTEVPRSGRGLESVARLEIVDVSDRLTELAALERAEATEPGVVEGVTDILTAVRTELARAREQRDRALDLAGQVIRPLEGHAEWAIDRTAATAELARLHRMRDGLDERQPSTLYDTVHAVLLGLADQLPGEPAPVLLAWGVDQLAARLTDAVEASGLMGGSTS